MVGTSENIAMHEVWILSIMIHFSQCIRLIVIKVSNTLQY